ETIRARANGLRVDGEIMEVKERVIDGQGQPIRAQARVAKGRVQVDAEAPDIDLARVARFAGKAADLRGGHVALTLHLDARGRDAEGELHLDARGLDAGRFRSADAHLDSTLEGRNVVTHFTFQLPDTAMVKMETNAVTLDGPALDPRSWRRATGSVA